MCIGEWIVTCPHNGKLFTDKKKKLLIHARTWTNLIDIILDKSQTQTTAIICLFLHEVLQQAKLLQVDRNQVSDFL